jgi:hypothetical protein
MLNELMEDINASSDEEAGEKGAKQTKYSQAVTFTGQTVPSKNIDPTHELRNMQIPEGNSKRLHNDS